MTISFTPRRPAVSAQLLSNSYNVPRSKMLLASNVQTPCRGTLNIIGSLVFSPQKMVVLPGAAVRPIRTTASVVACTATARRTQTVTVAECSRKQRTSHCNHANNVQFQRSIYNKVAN